MPKHSVAQDYFDRYAEPMLPTGKAWADWEATVFKVCEPVLLPRIGTFVTAVRAGLMQLLSTSHSSTSLNMEDAPTLQRQIMPLLAARSLHVTVSGMPTSLVITLTGAADSRRLQIEVLPEPRVVISGSPMPSSAIVHYNKHLHAFLPAALLVGPICGSASRANAYAMLCRDRSSVDQKKLLANLKSTEDICLPAGVKTDICPFLHSITLTGCRDALQRCDMHPCAPLSLSKPGRTHAKSVASNTAGETWSARQCRPLVTGRADPGAPPVPCSDVFNIFCRDVFQSLLEGRPVAVARAPGGDPGLPTTSTKQLVQWGCAVGGVAAGMRIATALAACERVVNTKMAESVRTADRLWHPGAADRPCTELVSGPASKNSTAQEKRAAARRAEYAREVIDFAAALHEAAGMLQHEIQEVAQLSIRAGAHSQGTVAAKTRAVASPTKSK